MASMKLATVTTSIKGFHVYRRIPDIDEKLKCVLDETNRHSNRAIKFVGDASETIGHKGCCTSHKKINCAFS